MSDEFPPVEWVDELPPITTTKGRELYWFAEQLKKHPGRWAKLPRRHNYSSQIKSGKLSAFLPVGAFEAVQRRSIDAPKSQTYVRYVGLNPDPPTSDGASVKRSPVREDNLRQLTS